MKKKEDIYNEKYELLNKNLTLSKIKIYNFASSGKEIKLTSKKENLIKKVKDNFLLNIPKNFNDNLYLEFCPKKNSFFYLKIIQNENSKCNLIIKIEGKQKILFCFLDVLLKNRSLMNFFSENSISSNSLMYSKKKFYIGNKSTINFFQNFFSFKKIFSETIFFHKEFNASSNINEIFLSNKSNFESKIFSYHLSNETNSNILIKGILKNSKSHISGLIDISKNSKNSNAYQKIENILLDEFSKAISIPNLKIKNNKVSCTHGASTFSLDKEKLFYIMSRGISEKKAKKEIMKSFFLEIIKKIDDEKIRDYFYSKIDKRINYLVNNGEI
ncbi:MAG: SufD family Fe-S cluster assembly protein [Candidatus Pacearchaeota archaeon]